MGADSKIEWCDHSFNPVIGCAKVGPGCDNCYAEVIGQRFGAYWGPHAPLREMSEDYWRDPLRWNRQAAAAGRPALVFCASLADVFDKRWPTRIRERLWALIRQTPHLIWILVTKRIGNAADLLPAHWGKGYPNVWLLATICTQAEADRDVPKLLQVPAALHGLSAEPLLGELDIRPFIPNPLWNDIPSWEEQLGWVIGGYESGPEARLRHLSIVRYLRDQCVVAGVPFLFKQWGTWAPVCAIDTDALDSQLYHPAPAGSPEGRRRPKVEEIVAHRDGSLHRPGARGAYQQGTGAMLYMKVGKSIAGRVLDGRTWDQFPAEARRG